MSWKATGIVSGLTHAFNGNDKGCEHADAERGQACPHCSATPFTQQAKFVYLLLSDAHNTTQRGAWESLPVLADLAVMDEAQCRRQIRWLEDHGEILQVNSKYGRGHVANYIFLRLDPPETWRKITGGATIQQIEEARRRVDERRQRGRNTRPHIKDERGTEPPPSMGVMGALETPFLPSDMGEERGRKGGAKGVSSRPLKGSASINARENVLPVKEPVTERVNTSRDAAHARPVDHRHAVIREAIQRLQLHFLKYELWDGSAAKKLSVLLESVPKCRAEDLIVALVWWAMSPDTVHGKHPRIWLPHLPAYQQGPLDNFRPVTLSGAAVGSQWTVKRQFEELLAIAKGEEFGVQQHLATGAAV